MRHREPITTILCAGPGLGFYVPGIIMDRQLTKNGLASEVHVFEDFLIQEKKNNVKKTKSKFHNNFSYALMAQQLAKDPTPYLDEKKVSILLERWEKEGRKSFAVFSGFWISILQQFISNKSQEHLNIQLCHVDADHSTSWKLFDTTADIYDHIWFNNWEQKSIQFHMDVGSRRPAPFKNRKNELVIHGGGWGMGTYKEKIEKLQSSGFNLNVIAYEHSDIETSHTSNNFYLLDPEWKTWDRNSDEKHFFPPLGSVDQKGCSDFSRANAMEYPYLYDIIENGKGIISKPGAGTLMDSLSSATPIIILEPFGDYEKKNGQLWKHFGLGIAFEDWVDSGFSLKILEEMHHNLLNVKNSTRNYVETHIKSENNGI